MDIERVNTIVYCENWAETIAFYKDKLKLPVTVSFDWFVEFRLNETSCLSIANEKRTAMNSSHGRGHTLTMKVADVRSSYSELKEAGLNPTEIKRHQWGADVMYLYDPEGNRLEFWSEIIQAPPG